MSKTIKGHTAAESQSRTVRVKILYERRREKSEFGSISGAVKAVKEHDGRGVKCAKIVVDEEVVYNSNRNGSIEKWEREWKRAKRLLSRSEETHDCPHNTNGCVKGDLCMECQLDETRDRSYE